MERIKRRGKKEEGETLFFYIKNYFGGDLIMRILFIVTLSMNIDTNANICEKIPGVL